MGNDDDTALFEAIAALQRGDRDVAREALRLLWRAAPAHDEARRCVIGHYLADACEDLEDEHAWDSRALECARRAVAAGTPLPWPGLTWASFFPSLHLNLASVCERRGCIDDARGHIADARASLAGVPAGHDGDRAHGVRAAVQRAWRRLHPDDDTLV
jgi:hypothetical protein